MITEYIPNFLNVGIKVLYNVDTSKMSSIRIGGITPYLFIIYTVYQLQYLSQIAFKNSYRVVVLGKCSNTVVSNQNIDQILFVQLKGTYFYQIQIEKSDVTAGSSTYLPNLISQCSHTHYCGMERLIGIPGTVGGAIYMNAGITQYNIGDFVKQVKVMHPNGAIEILNKRDIVFGYRATSLQKSIILSAKFMLEKVGFKIIQRNICESLLSRKKTQPVSVPSLGSIFKNLPHIQAWELIRKFELQSLSIGKLKLSKKHFNFIIHDATAGQYTATTADLTTFIHTIQSTLFKKCEVLLETEVKIY